MSKALVDLLYRDRVIPQTQYDEALSQGGGNPVRYLIDKKYVAETKLLFHLSKKFGLQSINLAKYEITPEVASIVPADLVRKYNVVPIQSQKGTLVVAVADPTNLSFLEDFKFRFKLNIEAVMTTFSALEAAISKYYGGAAVATQVFQRMQKQEAAGKAQGAKEESSLNIELVQVHNIDQGSIDQDAPVITLVNAILAESIRKAASDIHVEPYEKRFRVRMRIDGTMHEIMQVPLEMKRAVIARFKIMSRMDIAETRVPQDGRIKLKTGSTEIDFRVNSMPTLFGEKIVLRMLNKGNLQLDLQKLGFEVKQLETFKKGIDAPNGLVLVTGPTGSGKTTTLYSALAELNKVTENLSTAEDPVEYNLEGINQVQVMKEVGLTFASVLRALLRQDPDTILVGEIRDYETAEVSIQAALTGHLVLSTLHTNDAPSTITRLINMGIEPFLVVAALNSIVAQRLLRTVCKECKTEATFPKEKLLELGLTAEEIASAAFARGRGCQACNNSGYKGRVAIYEVLDFTSTLKEMVLRGQTVMDIRRQAIKDGMKSLRMSALSRALEGRTTLEEALSSTMEA